MVILNTFFWPFTRIFHCFHSRICKFASFSSTDHVMNIFSSQFKSLNESLPLALTLYARLSYSPSDTLLPLHPIQLFFLLSPAFSSYTLAFSAPVPYTLYVETSEITKFPFSTKSPQFLIYSYSRINFRTHILTTETTTLIAAWRSWQPSWSHHSSQLLDSHPRHWNNYPDSCLKELTTFKQLSG